MHLPSTLTNFLAFTPFSFLSDVQQFNPLATQLPQQHHLTIPSRYESTVLARRLLALSRTGTLSTIFPANSSQIPQSSQDSASPPPNSASTSSDPASIPLNPASSLLNLASTSPDTAATSFQPPNLSDTPIGLPEYIAACESSNPTILALTVSTSTKNAYAGSNVSLSISWWDEYQKLTGREYWSMANLPRASLIGYLEEIPEKEVREKNVVKCFLKSHGDARWWLPGDRTSPHHGVWMRMMVQEVYWIGGFGDRAFIGWFDVKEWEGVEDREWKGVRLPGEKR